MKDDVLADLERWLHTTRKRLDKSGDGRGSQASAVLDVLYTLRSIVDDTIDRETVRGRAEGAHWRTLASTKQAAQLRHKRAVARGVHPRGVKDGPYGYELTADGRRLVDMPERYNVIVGGADTPDRFLWSCVELPAVSGAITDITQVHATAKAAIERHLGRKDFAVYVDLQNVGFEFRMPRGLSD